MAAGQSAVRSAAQEVAKKRRQVTAARQQAAAARTKERNAVGSRGVTNGVCSNGTRSATVGRDKTERGALSRRMRRKAGEQDDDAHAAVDVYECRC